MIESDESPEASFAETPFCCDSVERKGIAIVSGETDATKTQAAVA
jgi:hypothetical protein